MNDHKLDLRFCFVDQVDDTEIVLSSFDFTFYDFDNSAAYYRPSDGTLKNEGMHEQLVIDGYELYKTSESVATQIVVDDAVDGSGRLSFTSSEDGTGADNPECATPPQTPAICTSLPILPRSLSPRRAKVFRTAPFQSPFASPPSRQVRRTP